MAPDALAGSSAATRSAQSVSDTASASAPPREPLSRRGLSGKLALGGSYQRFHTVPLTSGELHGAIGGRLGAHSGYATLELLYGKTEFGLTSFGGYFGALTDWSLGRLRLGGQVRVGALSFSRVTETDDGDLASVSVGARVHVAFDVLRLESEDALYVEAFLRGEYYDPFVVAPGIAIGFRWEGNRRIGRSQYPAAPPADRHDSGSRGMHLAPM
jgi:hypothetical protein